MRCNVLTFSPSGILEAFLAVMFKPTNSHCIHVDASTPEKERLAIEGVVKCYKERFPEANIFTIKYPIQVYWGKLVSEVTDQGALLERIGANRNETTLQADMMCMRELLRTDKHWKYFLNPAATELPLITIEQMERLFRESGEDWVEVWKIHKLDEHRKVYTYSHEKLQVQ